MEPDKRRHQADSNNKDSVISLAVLSNRNLASGLDGGMISIRDLKTGKSLRELIGHTYVVFDLLLLPDGRLASASNDATIRIWNTETGKQLNVLRGHTQCVFALTMQPEGKTLFSGSDDKTVRVWSSY